LKERRTNLEFGATQFAFNVYFGFIIDIATTLAQVYLLNICHTFRYHIHQMCMQAERLKPVVVLYHVHF